MNLKNQLTKGLISVEELQAMAKAIKRREVDEAAKKYQQALIQWGENNQITQRAEVAYNELRWKWEAENGKKYAPLKSAKGETLMDVAPQYTNQTLANRLRDPQEEK